MKSVGIGLENLYIISDAAFDQVQRVVKDSTKVVFNGDEEKHRLSVAELYFESYMRWLDSQVCSVYFKYQQ